jgi:hypothetical protein
MKDDNGQNSDGSEAVNVWSICRLAVFENCW